MSCESSGSKVFNMDSFNTSREIYDSSLLQNVSNVSIGATGHQYRGEGPFYSLAIFLVCLFGLPGNLLVIAVYARKMVTSTTVYMFALAVADMTICICDMFENTKSFGRGTKKLFVTTNDVVVTFSVFLLVFVSVERLLAVMRPHRFSLDALRAKKALVAITVTASVHSSITFVADNKNCILFERYFRLCVLVLCVLIMVVCYIAIAVTLLKKAKRNRVGILPGWYSTKASPSNQSTKADNTGAEIVVRQPGEAPQHHTRYEVKANAHANATGRPHDPGPSCLSTNGKAITGIEMPAYTGCSKTCSAPVQCHVNNAATHVKTYRILSMLFVITVVFVVCWMPVALANIGVSVNEGVRRMYLLNSVINPFIYRATSAMFREDVRELYLQIRTKWSAYFNGA